MVPFEEHTRGLTHRITSPLEVGDVDLGGGVLASCVGRSLLRHCKEVDGSWLQVRYVNGGGGSSSDDARK